jgi:hypothetical protein
MTKINFPVAPPPPSIPEARHQLLKKLLHSKIIIDIATISE